MFVLSLLALFVSPLILKLVLPENVRMVIPYSGALLFLLLYLFVPLLAGMLLLGKLPGAATKLSRPLAFAGVLAFVAFMEVTGTARKAASEIGLAAAGAMLLFIFISLAVGWFMGGPTPESRQILATATSMRNAALCVAIVESIAPGHAVLVPLIAFILLMVPPNTLLTVYLKVQAIRQARKAS
jgi:BASS family bile acid:Na+ symporter